MYRVSPLPYLLVAACIPPHERLEYLAEEDPEKAVEKASDWLEKHESDHRYWDDVREVQARAAFQLAKKEDTVDGWQTYISKYSYVADLLNDAYQSEASAWYRDITLPANSIREYEAFIIRFPYAVEVNDCRTREVHIAFTNAQKTPGVEGLQQFQEHYRNWLEAEKLIVDAKVLEMQRAMEEAEQNGSPLAFRIWLDLYGSNTEAPELVAKVHQLADQAIAKQSVTELLDMVWTPQSVFTWFQQNRNLSALHSVSLQYSDSLLTKAESIDTASAWWIVGKCLPDTNGILALEKAKNMALISAQEPENIPDFITMFPSNEHSWDLEGQWISWRERYAPRSHQAKVQRRRVLPGGEVELTVDVLDCENNRVSGLTSDSFTLYDGENKIPVSNFTSIESDRPLSVTIAIDLSGSMYTEQSAVKSAVTSFAEILRFRNRKINIGLIGFSDAVVTNHAPSASVNEFIQWMRSFPDNIGGGGAEDTAGAVVSAVEQLSKTTGEHVMVMLSDERLQVNMRGRQALGIKETPCDEARAATGCIGSCADNDYSCLYSCLENGPARYAIQINRCGPGVTYCFGNVLNSVIHEANACQNVFDHPDLPSKLIQRLERGNVRSFFLATNEGVPYYQPLAQATGGRVLEVPDDTKRSEPYETALLDIADQLSKQYIITYKLSNHTPDVVVDPEWRWVPENPPEPLQSGEHSLLLYGETRLQVDPNGSVVRSLDGIAWREVLPSDTGRTALVKVDLNGQMICTDGATIYCSSDLGRNWDPLIDPAKDEDSMILATSGNNLYAINGDQTWILMRVVSRDIASSSLYFNVNEDQYDSSLEPFLRNIGTFLSSHPTNRLLVEGHADSRGSDSYNDDLAFRRASRVAQAVGKYSPESNKIFARSMGERYPVRLGNSEADYQQNRRVEMILLEPGSAEESICR